MAQIFRPSADTKLRVAVLAAAVLVVAGVLLLVGYPQSSYATRVGWVRAQPVPFSHKHHVGGLGIDCRFCHTSVETSAHAGLPSTKTCMTCHSQEWTRAPALAPVRESWRTGRPLQWQRVAKLPDYVYFDHAIHIGRGVPCTTCHGRVDRMPLMQRAEPFTMAFCTACHRDPLPGLGPRAAVTDPRPLDWSAQAQHRFAAAQAKRYRLNPARLDTCDICHR